MPDKYLADGEIAFLRSKAEQWGELNLHSTCVKGSGTVASLVL